MKPNLQFVIDHSYLIPLLPLAGAAVSGFLGARWLKGKSHWPIWVGVGIAAFLSIMLLFGTLTATHDKEGSFGEVKSFFTWIDVGNPSATYDKASHQWVDSVHHNAPLGDKPVHFSIDAGFWFDPLTAVMLSVVCGIGFFITVFAAGYMKGEEGYFRFFAYLGLFIFMMTCLVMGNNLVMLYLGWEGVGLSSYLLIGYYYEKPAAREAAKKAFLVNRIGDFGFGLGIMLCFLAFGTVSYFGNGLGTQTGLIELSAQATGWQAEAMKWIPFLLMLGAFGKSAQFPLYVWLPDAMEGPTPVSALIHAATMVTAGVYMIARCGTLFVGNQAAMITIAAVGAFTALFAATIALRQFDLKKVFAYSTISQLGFMFVGVGVLAPVSAVFHLVTHAFFKALLFLSSGVVMHAMGGVLDMRQMSGLRKVLPKTDKLMLAGCAALAGFPLMSGFFSKDEIVGASFGEGPRLLLGLVLLFTAFLTAYYTFRLYFQVFHGPLMQPEPVGHGGGAHAADPGAASASALHSGHGATSGVDTHLSTSTHQDAVGDHGQNRVASHGGDAHGHGSHDSHGHGAQGHAAHNHAAHDHEPSIMITPLIVLAFGAVFAGLINWPSGLLAEFLSKSPSFALAKDIAVATYGNKSVGEGFGFGEHAWFEPMMLVGAAVSLAGIYVAYLLHLKNRALGEQVVASFRPLARLLEGKYWVDEIYNAMIVRPLRMIGSYFFAVDRIIVDGLVSMVSFIPNVFGFAFKFSVQRGSLQGYASAMLFGVVVILLLVFLR